MYGNEAEVGAAIAAAGIPRDELYVTTKLNNGNHLPDDARRSFAESLEKLGLDRVDLFLIHWPLPTRYDGDFVTTWRTMVELRDGGGTTSIGVSNFEPAHLDRIIDETGVVPAVNQIEVNPYFTNEAARAADVRHGIATEAWSPIARGGIAGDETIGAIAERVGRYAGPGDACAGTSSAATSSSPSRRTGSGSRRTSPSSTSSSPTMTWPRSRPSIGASPAGPGRTRTRST